MRQLSYEVAVVTGAASGIGFALADRFAGEGLAVVLADRDAGALQRAFRALRDRGRDVLPVPTDVSDPASVEALRDQALARYGHVDVLCNNAGIVGGAGVTDPIDLGVWHTTLEVDLFGVVHGVRAFLPHLLERNRGHIVNTASRVAFVPTVGMAPYCIAKAAVVSLSEMLHLELRERGSAVGVTVLCPGTVRTPQRTRVAAGDGTLDDPRVLAAMRERASNEVDARDVAGLVVDAISDGRLFVFTHRQNVEAIQARHARIEADAGAAALLR